MGSSWFETVIFVSALAMPPDLGIPLRTSCSAGRSAGLDSFVVSFAQTKAGDYYRNWNREGNFFSSEEWLFGRRCDKCSWCVVGDFFSKSRFGIFEINYDCVQFVDVEQASLWSEKEFGSRLL